MTWRGLAVAALDAVVLILIYLVLQDLSWRASYVKREGLVLHTTFLPLIRLPTITGSVQTPLASPPVLDWVQLLILLLVIANGSYLFFALRKQRGFDVRPDSST